ncbi:MAG: ATP-binding cassette domain-containing protein [Desulfobacterales bacterium]|nr:ATP-binding cassette domain-containing protein [Desulfobacterales bacterium]
MRDRQTLIKFENVSKSFGSKQVLDRVNLEIFDNQTTTIIGKSGSGKSVLLKHIIGLLNPDEGVISFRGKPLTAMGRRDWDEYRSQISFCFQNNALFDSLTVFENIALPLRKTTRLSHREVDAKVFARLEQMELIEVPDKYPADLSGGMQKRVALARALITDPGIVLFDEPTTGQDPIRKNAILGMIAQYQKKFGFTTIMISHELPDVFFISDRILVLYDKKIVFQGNFQELQGFDHPFVDEFVNSLEEVQLELHGLWAQLRDEAREERHEGEEGEDDGFTVIVLEVENMDRFSEHFGQAGSQTFLQTLGSRINSYFSSRGLSNRCGPARFVSILVTCNIAQTETLLADFAGKIQAAGAELAPEAVLLPENSEQGVGVRIIGGIAKGTPAETIADISERALAEGRLVAQFTYTTRA